MRYLLSVAALVLLAAPLDAATVDEAAKEIVGAWKLEFTTPDDVQRTPTVIVGRQHQELVAWYIEKDKLEEFKEVRLKDETLLLTFRPEERRDTKVTFEAQLKDDDVCFGTGTYVSDSGDSGTWDFEGKRMLLSDYETETWSLSFVTPDGEQRKADVTVISKDEKLYGWYSSEEYELPALKFSMDGDKVVMSITVKMRDGAKVDVTFRGTVTGDRVKGEAEYDAEGDTGSFSFSGQRKA